MENLFVYGTLRDKEVQKKVYGRSQSGEPDKLHGYAKSTIVINNNTYPILVENKSGSVDGFVLNINSDELKKIDEYETKAYRRVQVMLESGKRAWVYAK